MRIECDRCARVGPANLAAAASGAFAHVCSFCGATSTFTPGAAPVTAPADGRECPKCGERPVTGVACRRCGLATERMDGFVADEEVPEALAAAWDACRERWDQPASHEQVAALALTHERYPWLARRYRTVLRDQPGDPIATARLHGIGRMVEAALRVTAAPPIARPRRNWLYAVMVVAVVLIAVGMIYAVRVIGARREGGPGTRTPAAPAAPKHPGSAQGPRTPIESPSSGR